MPSVNQNAVMAAALADLHAPSNDKDTISVSG
jgi:hypothetical protein